MFTCFYYWFVQPMRQHFQDSAEATPVWEVPVQFKGEKLTLSIFVDDLGPQYARVAIPNLPSEEIPERLFPVLQSVREHLISTLRLTYHPETTLFPNPMWTFSTDPATHKMGFEFTAQYDVPAFDAERARNIFVGAFDIREDLRLFIDGADANIPLQYRFLSAYKLLELEFKTRGQWRKKEFDEFLEPYIPRFQEIGVRRKPSSYLADLRDKCAHIKTGRRKEQMGVTHLNHKEAVQVEKALPILGDIGIAILQRRGKGKVTIERRKWFGAR